MNLFYDWSFIVKIWPLLIEIRVASLVSEFSHTFFFKKNGMLLVMDKNTNLAILYYGL